MPLTRQRVVENGRRDFCPTAAAGAIHATIIRAEDKSLSYAEMLVPMIFPRARGHAPGRAFTIRANE